MNKAFTTLFLSLLTYTIATAQQQGIGTNVKKKYEHVKERTISKTYDASGTTLQIDNQFGSVTVSVWDKNEIKVEVLIKASSSSKDIAEKIFDRLKVDEFKNDQIIKFKSKFDGNKDNNYNCKNCSSQMEMSYTIKVPSYTPLDISNEFGFIKVPDYKGSIKLTSRFGLLVTGSLVKAEKLWVEFGKATIKSVSNVSATFKYSTVLIENLSGNNTIQMDFCNSSKIILDNYLTGLKLNESYGTVTLKPASALSATYQIRTSFGSVKNKSNANIRRTDKPNAYGPDNEHTYEGKTGTGAAKIEIRSSFGRIIIGEASTEEMNEKVKGTVDI